MEERKSLSKLSNTQVQINVAAKVKENLKTFKTGANDVVVVRQANANASYKATPLHIRYDWKYIEAKKKAIDIQIFLYYQFNIYKFSKIIDIFHILS